jgi:hypothetical protein
MDFSNKPVWLILGVPLLALAAWAFWGESDREKFDRLKIGMSAGEVQNIIFPPASGKYAHMRRMEVGDNENLHLNNSMVLIVRDGVLVDKQWTGPNDKE